MAKSSKKKHSVDSGREKEHAEAETDEREEEEEEEEEEKEALDEAEEKEQKPDPDPDPENDQVVTTEPQSCPPPREWHDGLFQCTQDVGNCFFVAFCPMCALCQELHKLGENPVLSLCFTSTLMAASAQYRAMNHIGGSLCCDFLTSYCCGPCALCRLHRDIRMEQKK